MFQIGLEKFDFLRKMALKTGAVDAKVITADKVVVEDRIVLKCKVPRAKTNSSATPKATFC